jgi:hypothetical protein
LNGKALESRQTALRAGCIEHDPEKWKPVFPDKRLRLSKDHAQTKWYRWVLINFVDQDLAARADKVTPG